jgi:quinohemoprotein amine dehydrogenase
VAPLLVAGTLVPSAAAQPGADRAAPPPGIPITSDAVVGNCSACHARDSTGRMGRLSSIRKTPEGWQTSIRRMVSLNGVRLDPEVAREIVRYLANRHGLAPEEARPGRFEAERRMIDYSYTADRETESTCKPCHSLGRVITERRTREEWELLIATHRAYYPVADFQAFRRGGPPPDTGDRRHPMEKAIAHLSTAFPLETPEWRAWSATMRPPRLEGSWLLSGYEPGLGSLHGWVTVTADPRAPDEFATEATYTYAGDGRQVVRRGRAVVYTGFQWRGRSWSSPRDSLREVMFVERDWREMSGRWFRGAYDELGVDVTLRRLGSDPVIARVEPRALRSGAESEVRIFGANLPASLGIAAIDLGPGVHTLSVSAAAGGAMVTARVRVDSAAVPGRRDAHLGAAHLEHAVVVYDTVSRIKVTPPAGMARIGGAAFPKQLQQFEAAAWHDGPDGKPNTADDLPLGRVPVTWSLEEYTATFGDDDLRFVGAIDQTGLFTPALDGPNPDRSGNRNNVGDVWVVATYAPPGGGTPLKARAHLLVTVPLYLRWEPWQVTR